MTRASDLAAVVALACETEDRTPGEQRALERVADRLDQDRNVNSHTNRRFDHDGILVPCTAPWHDLKCRTCTIDRSQAELLVRPFTDRAKAEPLVNDDGWSIAGQAVRTR